MMQPAARIKTTPVQNISIFLAEGLPSPAIHNAHKVGHSNKSMPIGRSNRISRQ
jgi:hypothetical protein